MWMCTDLPCVCVYFSEPVPHAITLDGISQVISMQPAATWAWCVVILMGLTALAERMCDCTAPSAMFNNIILVCTNRERSAITPRSRTSCGRQLWLAAKRGNPSLICFWKLFSNKWVGKTHRGIVFDVVLGTLI